MAKQTPVRSRSQYLVDTVFARVNPIDWTALRTLGPIYLTSAGLAGAYSWGWLITYGPVVGAAIAAFAVTCELIKPAIGERFDLAVSPLRKAVIALTAIAAMAVGAGSAVIAIHAAEAPTRAYERGQSAIADASRAVEGARLDLARYDCTTDMPLSRCRVFQAQNSDAKARAERTLGEAEAALARTVEIAPAAPYVEVPEIPLWIKLFVGLGIDFVLIAFPWAARAEHVVVQKRPADQADAHPAKINDGGWSTRRANYGPSGIKRKSYGVIEGGRA